ncbi:serine protease [Actinokineospora auranticolor]|uniref:Trypsin n=1 Tax=Actinokineospora auranticolor TaxID=155976 RepID=A0A2S6GUS5_9PSEU|nr:serine protease [Actinokineospora auranticolor]PPK68992.1 trypsin [Actinokineospora auranticolor]
MSRSRRFLIPLLGLVLALAGIPATADVPARVVGGTRAPQGAYPWMARLSMGCGGSLIAPEVVLTAGHCVDGTGPDATIQATFGVVDLQSPKATVVKSVYVYRPEQYTTVSRGYDWALIKLATRVKAPVLPLKRATVTAGPFRVLGWGADKEGGDQQRYLLHAEVPYVDDATCAPLYTRYGYPFLPSGMLCAGIVNVGGVDTCQGDSGGPMVIGEADGTPKQVGIVSWGVGCARPRFPGIYTEIATYAPAIQAAVALLTDR